MTRASSSGRKTARGARRSAAPARSAGARRGTTPARGAAAPPAPDNVERLWAPWRMEFIGRARGRKAERCLFCRVAGSSDDRADLVLARRPEAFLMLNRYPYTGGHLMAAVRAHRPDFSSLSAAERGDLIDLVALAERALEAEYRPHGMNLGVNVGRIAGAGFPGHLHVHVVPRWEGDTNFMTTVSATRVLPESLDRTWQRLRGAIERIERGGRGRRRRGAQG